jgi:hypothetical protein
MKGKESNLIPPFINTRPDPGRSLSGSLKIKKVTGFKHGCSSIGRVVVSKTIGWEFESLHPCSRITVKIYLADE